MNTQIEAQIESVGQLVIENVPRDARTTWLYGEAQEGAYSVDIFYRLPDNIVHYEEATIELCDAVYRLWQLCGEHGPDVWSTMTMSLGSDGKFGIDYTYEDLLTRDGTASTRRKQWLLKYTGSASAVYRK